MLNIATQQNITNFQFILVNTDLLCEMNDNVEGSGIYVGYTKNETKDK